MSENTLPSEVLAKLASNQAEIDATAEARKTDQALQLRLASEAAASSAPGIALWEQFAKAYPNTALGQSVSRDLSAFQRTFQKLEAEAAAAQAAAQAAEEASAAEEDPPAS